jgi:competence protein ComEC
MTSGANKQPLNRPQILFSFALGLAFVQQLPALPDPLISIFLLLSALIGCVRWSRAGPLCALIAGAAYAMLAGSVALSKQLQLAHSGQTYDVVVEISGLPVYEHEQWQFQGEVMQASGFESLQGERIKLAWYRSKARLQPGDVWRFKVLLRAPNGVQNPGGFDAERRALEQNIVAQGYVKRDARFLFARPGLDRWRDELSNQIGKALGAPQARFVQALALGDTRGLSDADWERLRQTGITHLIAISGFHVGIVALFAAWIMHALYGFWPNAGLHAPRPLAVALISILAAIAYTAIAGFAIATVRTAWMIALFMAARLCYRSIRILHAVALSMFLMLVWDPFCIFNAGFWLSFAGVLLLAIGMPGDTKPGWFWPFIKAQYLVSIGLFPITVMLFGQTTVIGPLVNLIAIPLISLIIVPLALLGVLFSACHGVANVFWALSAWLMQQFWIALEFVAALPWASVYLPEPTGWVLLLAAFGVVLLLLPRPIPGRALGLVLLLPLWLPKMPPIEQGQMRVAMLDVGQGLSVLVQTAGHRLLYDTGAGNQYGFSRGESTVVPALRALGIGHLDMLVLSHADNDHSGGFEAVQKAISSTQVREPVAGSFGATQACRAGQRWQWDAVDFKILWPDADLAEKDNDRSCVLLISTGRQRLLLTGDITAAVENELLARYPDLAGVDILLVPHHGSKTSSSTEFLQVLRPQLGLVSSGFQNRFRHPNPDVAARYREHGIEMANSVDTGWAELLITPDSWRWWHRERLDNRRYWMRSAR